MNFIKRYHPAFLWLFGIAIVLVVVAICGIVSSAHRIVSVGIAHKALHTAPQSVSTLSVSGDGTMRVFGIVLTSIDNGTIMASGTVSGIPTTFTLMTSDATTFHVANATSTLDDLAPGEALQVAGTLISFAPTITIEATDVRALWIVGPGQIRVPIVSQKPSSAVQASSSRATSRSTTTVSSTTTKK